MRLQQALGDCSIWPFELRDSQYTIAEIYPSLLPLAPLPNEVKDQSQVRTLEAHLSQPGTLASYLAAELPPSARTEGWILGLTGVK